MLRFCPWMGVLLGCLVACDGDDDGVPDNEPDASVELAKLQVGWSLSNGTQDIECTAVGASFVTLTAIPQRGGTAYIDSFPCGNGTGETAAALLAGRYDVELDLRAPAGQLGETVRFTDVVLAAGETRSLGSAAFITTTQGTFRASLAVSGGGPLCTQNGGEIARLTVSIESYLGECLPLTLSIDDESTELMCPPVAFAGCLPETTVYASPPLIVGRYRLRSIGDKLIGEEYVPCFYSDSVLSVYGGDLVTELPSVRLLRDANNAACAAP